MKCSKLKINRLVCQAHANLEQCVELTQRDVDNNLRKAQELDTVREKVERLNELVASLNDLMDSTEDDEVTVDDSVLDAINTFTIPFRSLGSVD